jgi:hypothetical protein
MAEPHLQSTRPLSGLAKRRCDAAVSIELLEPIPNLRMCIQRENAAVDPKGMDAMRRR